MYWRVCDDHRRRRGGGLTGPSRAFALPQQQILRPTANGTYTEWGETLGSGTTHWDRVDDVTPDDGGSYIMDNTWNGAERDTFQLSDTSYTAIASVQVFARASRITTNDNNNVRLFVRSGSTDSQSPPETLSMSWGEVSYSWLVDPNTGLPWTQAAVNALQAGVRNAMGPSGGGGVGVTQVYVVVTEGNVGAEILRPTANGSYLEWGELWGSGTTHWDRVAEALADDSGSYIFDNTWNGTERDTFQFSDTSYSSIGSVEVVARAARITTNDNNNVGLFIRSGSTDAQSPPQTLSMPWNMVSYTWPTDPATGLAWTPAAINALQAGVRNAMGPSGGGGVAVTQVYVVVHADPVTYPSPSIGAENHVHFGGSYSRWANAGAASGFVINVNGIPLDQSIYDQEAIDAASAYQRPVNVYVYFCIYPTTTAYDLDQFVLELQTAGVYNYINAYNGSLIIVYDIEDGRAPDDYGHDCGSWMAFVHNSSCPAPDHPPCVLDLPTVGGYENLLTYWSQYLINGARAHGLASSRPVAFSTTPGINCGPCQITGTSLLADWVANGFPPQFVRMGTYFPELFGPNFDTDWGSHTASRLQTFNSVGLSYSQTNPNWEGIAPPGEPCDTQANVDSMKSWYLYVSGGLVNAYTWYVYKLPFCVP